MKLNKLLPLLKSFRIIVITGPQRSGTTVATKIIAQELGYRAVLEERFREDDIVAFGALLTRRRRIVVQAPALSCIVHLLKAPELAVIFMMRDISDVVESEARIGWTFEEHEKRKYLRGDCERPISEIKQMLWKKQQSAMLANRGFTLEYESLNRHSLWIEKCLRKEFHPRQTALQAVTHTGTSRPTNSIPRR